MPLDNYDDIEKFSRQILVPEINIVGQEKLSNSHIVVVGCGGLGCPLLLYLAASGIGKITLIDDDIISLSNLHRQILFNIQDIGLYKAKVAAQKLQNLHADTHIVPIIERLDTNIANQYCRNADLVIDGSDSFLTKYILDEIAKPLLIGSVVGMQGYIAGFSNKTSYRTLFPTIPTKAPNCSETGVLGSVAGMIGSFMATEAIKIIIDHPAKILESFIQINLNNLRFNQINLFENSQDNMFKLPSFEFIDYNNVTDEVIIDIREDYELADFPLLTNSVSMPLSKFNFDRLQKIPNFILKCHSGRRAEKLALKIAFKNMPFSNIKILKSI